MKLSVSDTIATLGLAGTLESLVSGASEHLLSHMVNYDVEAPYGVGFLTLKQAQRDGGFDRVRAGLLLCDKQLDTQEIDRNRLRLQGVAAIFWCANPRLAFCHVSGLFTRAEITAGIDPTAVVHPSATVGKDVMIGPHSIVGEGAEIGDGTVLVANVFVGSRVKLGSRVKAFAGVVLGADGFGFEKDERGHWVRFPHNGTVIVGDDVEIGANTCIDRAAIGVTRIGRGTKIDNLCHISHNCDIGPDCMIIAGAIICGSTKIGPGAWIAPGASILQKLNVGAGATVGLGSVVLRDVPAHTTVFGSPAADTEITVRRLRALDRLISPTEPANNSADELPK